MVILGLHHHMADALDVVARSFNINSKLGPKLIAAAEQNAILRIGWTNAGDPVPKNGELGLCPGLPNGAKIRALGTLGSWTAAFGKGGTFTIQGDAGNFLGAGNHGNIITCEKNAGNFVGYGMASGKISVLDGCGDDAGSNMRGGLLVVRGNAGTRIGGGMIDGIIVVDGDVGNDPGAGMIGGKIIVSGRCPNPPEGITLRPITKSELKKVNEQINDKEFQIPNDSICLEPNDTKVKINQTSIVSSNDLSMIGLVPAGESQKMSYSTCDTVALLGERNEDNTPIALPIPLLPIINDGALLDNKTKEDSNELIQSQPFIVRENPRGIDFQIVNNSNIHYVENNLTICGGVVFDLMNLPSMNSEEIDGMLVAVRSLLGKEKPFAFSNGIGRVESLHIKSAYHLADYAICNIEDNTGISEPASLPLIGRSNKSNLENRFTDSAIQLGFSASAEDIAKLRASGMKIICCNAPAEDIDEIFSWLSQVHNDLPVILRRLGLDSIDSLSRLNLRALDFETAAVSGLRLSGYERPLPHWFAR